MNSDSESDLPRPVTFAHRLAERLLGRQQAGLPGGRDPASVPTQPQRQVEQPSLVGGAAPFLIGAAVGAAEVEAAHPKGETAHVKMSLRDECEERQKRDDFDCGYDRHELGRDTGLGL